MASTPVARSLAARALHALLLAAAAAVFAQGLTLPSGLGAAMAGAFAGSLCAERLERRRYRLFAVVALGILVAGLGLGLTGLLLGTPGLASAVGPTRTMVLGEIVRWASAAFGAALLLRAAALRYRAALAIEGSVAVLVVASTVSAHRDGMIARPLELSDWFWRQGIDPVYAFLGVGVLGAMLLAGLLAYGRSARRTLAQLLVVLVVGLLLSSRMESVELDAPQKNPVGTELGKKKDGKRDGPAAQGGGGSGQGDQERQSKDSDLPPPPKQSGRSNRPAAVVVFHRDVQPFGGVFYFRHAAFSQFNGARLVEATDFGRDPDARYDQARSRKMTIEGQHVGGDGRVAVATDVALMTEHTRTFALTDAEEVEPIPNPEPARFRRAYRVLSHVVEDGGIDRFLERRPGDPSWSDSAWEHYTEVPRDERYHDLARRLQAQVKPAYQSDPFALALMVKDYLQTNTIYSFKRRYEGDDPTAEFLFSEEKRGYCVHLAHSAAYLLRALGVPTRVSAGYAVMAKNLGSGSALLVKEGDAHAWAEVHLEGVGWVPIEVTPERTDVEPQPFEEKDLQQLLGEMARKEGRFERDDGQGPKLIDALRAIAAALPWVLLALLGLAYAIKVWRRLAPRLSGTENQPRLAYRAALDALAEAGHSRARGEPREVFAGRVPAPTFVRLTAVHVAAALGSKAPLGAAAGLPLVDLAAATGREVRRAVPAWRWMLGALNPVAWLWSR